MNEEQHGNSLGFGELAMPNRVVAEKNGYVLKEIHTVIYLYNWSVKNGDISEDISIAILEELISEFQQSPATTTMKLEQYAQVHFKKLIKILNGVVNHDLEALPFSEN